MPINQCELVLVNVVPVGNDSPISNQPTKEVGLSEHSVLNQYAGG